MTILLKDADPASINEFAQNLSAKLHENHDITLKHSKLLHSLAQMAGHSNWHAMTAKFDEIEANKPTIILNKELFKHGSVNVIVEAIFHEKEFESMWAGRAMVLTKILVAIFVETRGKIHKGEVSEFKKLMRLNDLIECYWTSKFISKHTRNRIGSFLNNLPASRQLTSMTFYEQGLPFEQIKQINYEQFTYFIMQISEKINSVR